MKKSVAALLRLTAAGGLICALGCEDQQIRKLNEEIKVLKDEVSDLQQIKQEVESLKSALNRSRLEAPASASDADEQDPNAPIIPAHFAGDGSEMDDPFLGSEQSSVVVMAFVDFQCQPCRKFYAETLPKLKQEFTETAKVRFILRDFPLSSNKYAKDAAVLAHCAGEQGAYWPMFQALFENPEAVDKGEFESLAQKVPAVDAARLRKCFKSDRYAKELDRDEAQGIRLGARGAPGFFIGVREPENGEYEGVFVRGAQPFPVLRSEILKLL